MWRIIFMFLLAKYTKVKVSFNPRKWLSNAKITTTKVSRLYKALKVLYAWKKYFPLRKRIYLYINDLHSYHEIESFQLGQYKSVFL